MQADLSRQYAEKKAPRIRAELAPLYRGLPA
jgi:hypothetical protein